MTEGTREPIEWFRHQYRFLSNSAPARVRFGGRVVPTVEHAHQMAKTNGVTAKTAIARCATPDDARELGATFETRPDWPEVRLPIMHGLLRQKFAHRAGADLLVATAPRPLVDTNTWGDTYWGVVDGVGENHLGRLLMAVRDELIAERAGSKGALPAPMRRQRV